MNAAAPNRCSPPKKFTRMRIALPLLFILFALPFTFSVPADAELDPLQLACQYYEQQGYTITFYSSTKGECDLQVKGHPEALIRQTTRTAPAAKFAPTAFIRIDGPLTYASRSQPPRRIRVSRCRTSK